MAVPPGRRAAAAQLTRDAMDSYWSTKPAEKTASVSTPANAREASDPVDGDMETRSTRRNDHHVDTTGCQILDRS